MSRLPSPDEQWVESTEGDLDPDLTEEWDWPHGTDDDGYRSSPFWSPTLMRIVMLILILALIVPAIAVTAR